MNLRYCSLLTLAFIAAPASTRAEGTAVTGTVRYVGAPRPAKTLPVTQDPNVCGKGKPDETLIVDGSGGMKNVVVSLAGVPGAVKPAPVTAQLAQHTCQFTPHVQALPTGSSVAVGNTDDVLHNVHGYRGEDTVFNVALPMKDMVVKRKLGNNGLHFFRCDAGHVWMSAYVWTFDHPYYAVTDASGHFSIADVPPGSYTLHVWHEGWKRKDGSATSIVTVPVTTDKPVKVEAGKPTDVAIELK